MNGRNTIHIARSGERGSNPPLCFPCLIVLVGPPGSGKSTWAWRNRFGAVHVSQDDLIDAITPGGFDHAYRAVYREAEDAVARAALRGGYTVIVDRTNRTRAHRERWLRIAREESCPACAVVMSTPEELCRERNARRDGDRRLSEDRMARMLGAMEPVRADEGFDSVHAVNGVGRGIGLSGIVAALTVKEKPADEYCHEAR